MSFFTVEHCKQRINTARQVLTKIEDLGPLLTRLALGIVFVGAGWGKFQNLDQVIGFFNNIGIPMANIQAPFVAGLEFLGGLFLIAGLFTRCTSLLLAFVMGVAICTAHSGDVKSFTDLLQLSQFTNILLFVWLVLHGAGKFSVDNKILKKL